MAWVNITGWLLLGVVAAASIGCDSMPTRFVHVSAEERALAAKLPVYREALPEGSYRMVGAVKGLSCRITVDDVYRVSEANAIEELQRATLRAGGNAVMEVRCENVDQRDSARRCWRSIECHGMAVQTTRVSED